MSDSIRTYGGWRRRRGLGLAGLDTTATFLVLGAALVFLVAASVQPALLLYLAPPAVLIGLLCFIHIGGQPIATFLLARIRWWWSSARPWRRAGSRARWRTASGPGGWWQSGAGTSADLADRRRHPGDGAAARGEEQGRRELEPADSDQGGPALTRRDIHQSNISNR